MRSRAAFTLIELVLYLGLVTTLSLLVYGFSGHAFSFMIANVRVNHRFVRQMATEDLLRRDLQVASFLPSDWYVEKCIFKQLIMAKNGQPIEKWVGYEQRHNGLYRREGKFDIQSKTWLKSFAALVNKYTKNISFRLVKCRQGTIKCVDAVMCVEGQSDINIVVSLRNRVLS